jgi:hypothetical protein
MKREYIKVIVELVKSTDEFNNVKFVEETKEIGITRYQKVARFIDVGVNDGEYLNTNITFSARKGHIKDNQEFYLNDKRYRVTEISETDNLNDYITAEVTDDGKQSGVKD